jgi:hypothetical protein
VGKGAEIGRTEIGKLEIENRKIGRWEIVR